MTIGKLQYCDKKSGNVGRCSAVAARQTQMISKKGETRGIWGYRCEEHAMTGTVGYKVIKSDPVDQSYELQKVNDFLKTLIGKEFFSKFHRENVIGKYLKQNGSIMCLSKNNKYKLVYYNQVELLP